MSRVRIADKFYSLIEVKKIIAITMVVMFCYLTVAGKITPENFMTVFTIVISFYFSQSSIRQAIKENNTKSDIIEENSKTDNNSKTENDTDITSLKSYINNKVTSEDIKVLKKLLDEREVILKNNN